MNRWAAVSRWSPPAITNSLVTHSESGTWILSKRAGSPSRRPSGANRPSARRGWRCALGTSCASSVSHRTPARAAPLAMTARRRAHRGARPFAPVPQQPLVDRPPPHAAGRRRVQRVEHPAARLPAHERQRSPPERRVSRRAARRPVEHPRHQCKTRRRIVAHGRDLRPSQGERACVAHREER